MQLRHARLARILVLLALTAVSARAHDPTLHGFSLVPFEPPFAAPAFTADALEGGRASLASYRGRHVLLNFWATWCAPCLEEMPSMDALYRDYRDRGLVVVAISSDREGAAVVQDFVERLGVSFPVLLDPQGAVAAQYGARNLPVSFVLDPGGRVVAAAQGARDWNAPEARSVIDEILSRP
jgi:peroxiredoxin